MVNSFDVDKEAEAREQIRRPHAGFGRMLALAVFVGSVIYGPASLYAAWFGELSRAYRLGVYVLISGGIVALLALTIARQRRTLWSVLVGCSVGWLVVANGGGIADLLPGEGVVTLLLGLLIAVFVGWATYRLRRLPAMNITMIILATILIGSPGVSIANAVISSVSLPNPPIGSHALEVEDGPDIWFLVLDTYPSADTLRQTFSSAGADLVQELAKRGFHINQNALTPYSMTMLAVPALLDGEYVLTKGPATPGVGQEIRRRVIGENRFVRSIARLDYSITVVENGWRFSGCAEFVDTCVAAPWLDEQSGLLLQRSLVGRSMNVGREDFIPRASSALIDWLADNGERIKDNGVPDLVYLHIMLPHSPLRFNAECGLEPDGPMRGGFTIGAPNLPTAILRERIRLYVEQVECISAVVTELIDTLGDRAIVGVVGDHGPDLQGQTEFPLEGWSEDMVQERMLTLAAVRLPQECAADLRSTMGVALAIVACSTGSELTSTIPRAFLVGHDVSAPNSLLELDSDTVEELLETAR